MTRAAIAAMTAYTLELREAATKLNQNENPFDVPADFKRELFARVESRHWNRYPDFESQALRDALAAAYGLRAAQILVGNGSNELLAAAIATFVAPGTRVFVPRPSFTLYEKLVTIAGGSVVAVDLDPRSEVLNVPAPAGGDVVIVCSPNNPTGGVIADGAIEMLLASGATVLYDRAYGDFAGDRIPPVHDNLVVFSTFSKAWGLAGLRVGWLASSDATCREIRKVKLPYSLNILSETAAILALEQKERRDAFVNLVIAERERMRIAMMAGGRPAMPAGGRPARNRRASRPPEPSQTAIDSAAAGRRGAAGETPAGLEVFPSRANFLAFRAADARRIFDQLCARGILIRDISSYPGLANCLRVSIGTPQENDAFLAALTEVA